MYFLDCNRIASNELQYRTQDQVVIVKDSLLAEITQYIDGSIARAMLCNYSGTNQVLTRC